MRNHMDQTADLVHEMSIFPLASRYRENPFLHCLGPGEKRAGRLELDLFSMLCSHEIFTDQSYHAWIRSENNSSIRSDACMTADYARGQPASAWPLAGQPCKVDCDLHTIARAHNRTFFVRLVRALCPHVPVVECSIMCTPIMHSTRSKCMPKWHFFL